MKKACIWTISLVMVLALALTGCAQQAAPSTAPSTAPAPSGAAPAPATSAAPAAAGSFDGTIKLGVVTPLSGAAAETGIANYEGIQMAVNEINAAGGVDMGGKKMQIALFAEDDQAQPELAVSAAEKLLTVDKVDILIGEAVMSSCTLAVMDLCPKYPDVLFTTIECVSTNIPKKVLSDPEKYKNFYKPCWNSDAYGDAIANSVMYLADQKGVINFANKTVAYIVEDTDYGRSNVTATEKAFEKFGAKTVAFEVVPSGHTDFYSQINKIKTLKPDLVVSCFVPVASGVAYCKQAKDLGVEWTDFGIVYPSKAGFYDQVGNNADKLFWTTLLVDFKHNDTHKAFQEKIKAAFPNTVPTQLHVSGYDITKMLFEAVAKAGTTKATQGLADAYSKSDYRGLYARFVFAEDHTAKTGEDYYPLTVAQVFGNEDYAVWPEKYATNTPVAQH